MCVLFRCSDLGLSGAIRLSIKPTHHLPTFGGGSSLRSTAPYGFEIVSKGGAADSTSASGTRSRPEPVFSSMTAGLPAADRAWRRPRIRVAERRLAVDNLAVRRLAVESPRKFHLAADQAGDRERGIVDRLTRAVGAAPSANDDLPGYDRALAGPLHFVQQRPWEGVGGQDQQRGLGSRGENAAGGLDGNCARRRRADRCRGSPAAIQPRAT